MYRYSGGPSVRKHVKIKLAFLVGHSVKALTPHPLPVSGSIAILCIFFLYMDLYMFLKKANSDTENEIEKNLRKSPEKNSFTTETL